MAKFATWCIVAAFGCLILISAEEGHPPADSRTTAEKYWVGQLVINCQRLTGPEGSDSSYCPSPGRLALNCSGKYGGRSPPNFESGMLVHVRTGRDKETTTGCETFQNVPKFSRWIALISRGDCKFDVKMQNAVRHNATAVVVYDNEDKELPVMSHEAYDMVSIIIQMDCGTAVAQMLDTLAVSGYYLEAQIMPLHEGGRLTIEPPYDNQSFNRTSVLIVSITFIVLMVFSLGWLVFYYVQRFRFANMKDKLSRQLAEAAKRAIKRIPKRTVRMADMSESNVCAVCIESYKPDDVVRELPCSHVFHKQCVDQWLISKRVCPMCKLNILEALGIHVKGEQAGTGEEQQQLTAASLNPAVERPLQAYEAEIAIVPASLASAAPNQPETEAATGLC